MFELSCLSDCRCVTGTHRIIAVRVGGEKQATQFVDEKSEINTSAIKADMKASFFGSGASVAVSAGAGALRSSIFSSANIHTLGGTASPDATFDSWRESMEANPNAFVVELGDLTDLVESEPKKANLKKFITEYLEEAAAKHAAKVAADQKVEEDAKAVAQVVCSCVSSRSSSFAQLDQLKKKLLDLGDRTGTT